MARVVNINNVRMNIARHGMFLKTSLISCLVSVFWLVGGVIRSRAEKKVMMRNIRPMTANHDIVQSHPCPLSPDSPVNLLTNGSVKPCTMNCAIVAATKRILVMLLRSLMSLVITPPSEA